MIISALPQHGQAVSMKQIYYNDGVNPTVCLHTCNTLEEAEEWINHELKGRTMVDDDHQCTEDVMTSSKTALYEVYDGEPIILNEVGEPNFAEPLYVSDHFYTE